MVINKAEVLVKDQHWLIVPTALLARVLQWYPHYLQHLDVSRLEETSIVGIYLPGQRANVKRLVKSYTRFENGKQQKCMYRNVPPEISNQVPW
jgi:hypothetical protein